MGSSIVARPSTKKEILVDESIQQASTTAAIDSESVLLCAEPKFGSENNGVY